MTTEEQRIRGILLSMVLVLAVLGVADGWYLTMVHVDYELSPDSALRKVCGALAANGCAVTTGRFGDVLGVPVSVIGMGGAAATAVTAAVARRQHLRAHDPWRSTAFALASVSVLASLLMGTLSLVEGSFCPFCVAWYGINLLMGLCAAKAWSLGDRGPRLQVLRDALGRPGAAAVATAVLGVSMGYGGYLLRRHTVLIGIANATLDQILEDETPVAMDLEGLPSTGSDDAPITVVEVADFECPFCRELWESIRVYSDENPSKVRVVFVHYPVDESCNPRVRGVHPQACDAARAAQCAHRYGALFDYGDLLFEHQPAFDPDSLVGYAEQLGLPEDEFRACLQDEATAQQVEASIARARRLGVQTTPTFLVNGYQFRGSRGSKWVKLVFDGLARRADDDPGAAG